ncbi:RidA family protein [Bosea vaviloviae]|uniref:Endoribonuclease L-PSP/chorismate mutase-like domain-containing protein n=1 Tax=Bosea vaviloviae TaxID=1526658 RepID=A0A1D7U5X1_9HYPH|nr:RidA family protein [Bosea vaviloviae]AOO82734.1 hypothetical protein BHK69_21885 [Bosea vaviloviae]
MTLIADKLAELGHKLPNAPIPVANYVPFTRSGNLLFIAGQISQADGKPTHLGRLGDGLDIEAGRKAAETATLCVLAQISAATDGSLAAVRRVLKLGVFIASAPDFTEHPAVANGASDLMVAVFGEVGRHARAAVGVAALPRGVSIEVDAVVELAE